MMRTIIARYRRLDCMVNSAGIGSDMPFLQTSMETFDRAENSARVWRA
jgi:short-subunit dehydrogenase